MFQYAAAKALACKHDVELAIDTNAFQTYALRNFLLDRFEIPEATETVRTHATGAAGNFRIARWRNRANRVLTGLSLPRLPQPHATYLEPHFHFDSSFFALGRSVSLHGYFQSERYFSGVAGTLRDRFRLREALGSQAQATADAIARTEMPVSVHIRRGDYVKSAETARVHGTLDAVYYRKALEILGGVLGSRMTVFVFSDDPVEAAAVLDFISPENLVHVGGDPARPWEDMLLMSRCRHHVIANSSFSWWGAWLNSSPAKTVVAPRQWFSAEELRLRNTCDLYPSTWILA